MKSTSRTSVSVAHRQLAWLRIHEEEYSTESTGLDELLQDGGPLAWRLRQELSVPHDARSSDPH